MARPTMTRSTTSRLEVVPAVLSLIVALLVVVVVGVLLHMAVGTVATTWHHATTTPTGVTR